MRHLSQNHFTIQVHTASVFYCVHVTAHKEQKRQQAKPLNHIG